jgi:hypothetical protein
MIYGSKIRPPKKPLDLPRELDFKENQIMIAVPYAY